MKNLFLGLVAGFFFSAQGTPSVLTESAKVTGFGEITYRAPVVESRDLPLVLFHGIYGGASHRTFKNILPLLDQAGKQVYILDLPGVGASHSPKRKYTIEVLDQFVERFLEEVVGKPAIVVGESLANTSLLKVAARRPDLIRRVIMLNPTGLKTLNEPPTERQNRLFERLYNNDQAALGFYNDLLVDRSLRYFLQFSFYNDDLIDDELLDDFRVARNYPSQKWISISFVGGQIYRPFVDSAEGVFVPVLGIFGAEYEAFQDNEIATAEDFRAVKPQFEYVEIENSGSSVQREQPSETVREILIFSERD